LKFVKHSKNKFELVLFILNIYGSNLLKRKFTI